MRCNDALVMRNFALGRVEIVLAPSGRGKEVGVWRIVFVSRVPSWVVSRFACSRVRDCTYHVNVDVAGPIVIEIEVPR